MGDLTKNLSRHEFACKCGCGFDTVDTMLSRILQFTADQFLITKLSTKIVGIFITIKSGCRCREHNESVGGSKNSRHMKGNAADFKIKYIMDDGTKVQIAPNKIAAYLDKKYPTEYGIGWYNGRTHFDTSSSGRRRWDSR